MNEQVSGRVVQIIGPVVDVEFPDQHLPAILNAVHIVDDGKMGKVPIDVTAEVAQHLGENRARCIAMEPTEGMVRTYLSCRDEERVINATQVNRVDGTKVQDLTHAELEGRRQVEPIVAFLRKNAPGFQNAYVSGMPAVIGVRETRRIRGIESLSVEDLIAGKKSPRAVVRGASFPIDIHNPAGIGQARGVSAAHPLGKDPSVKPYDIPYGCLVPKRVNGLLMAGRCISGTHEAMASYRVQVIAMATGIAAGTAAAGASRGAGTADPEGLLAVAEGSSGQVSLRSVKPLFDSLGEHVGRLIDSTPEAMRLQQG